MYYEEMDTEVKSVFYKTKESFANLASETQMPAFGLIARNLLDDEQYQKFQKIRNKKFKTESQLSAFYQD
ncbi:MAG TPA: hypothetical protein PL048_06470 [Leptospiraceae bacterium]|nr:hypothetical protein [Leptospiraceae bacterium]HMY69702.1 hypothetical protein [Leptospiraceae bacterium]HMZ58399.1 hypothetical protein [Leptospiraceae bacterium]HNF15927.1 hypothetical protein [Leptospiraceae bacterium]HNF22968.1 hypothetical protein [Leptospiraceae bacterium]